MRILATADLHYNHPRSRPLADELIDQMNQVEADALLLIGDTCSGTSDLLEQCLARFRFAGPKLFVPGNHELWSLDANSYQLFAEELPRRVRSAGWHWLQSEPWVMGSVGIVGCIGWYDYSFAPAYLKIPRRFYEHKISPGAAAHAGLEHLLNPSDDIPPQAMETFARWNDGRYVKLGRSDEAFLDELLSDLDRQLTQIHHIPHVLAAIHHLPFRELLPPPHNPAWDFAKAYLGSARIGDLLLRHPNVRQVLCGHTHMPAESQIGPIHAINIGAGYRQKLYRLIDI